MVVKQKRYIKNCPSCNAEQSYGRLDHYKSAVRGNWKCKKCSNYAANNKGKYHDIPVTWFSMKQKSGMSRGYSWTITIEDVWNLYEQQGKVCALSGRSIKWSDRGLTATVSIDRIDSSEGYILENVQLVHKDVNFMKQQFDQEYFLDTCRQIAEYQINQTKED